MPLLRRYLIISDERERSPVSNKVNHYSHFDIIPAKNIDEAIALVQKHRPKIDHTLYLTFTEIDSINSAMNSKTDEQLLKKFMENIYGTARPED